ncbi:MAG TPA: excalibur calcium-binding domain-containing protein [Sphingomicrobium sp.]
MLGGGGAAYANCAAARAAGAAPVRRGSPTYDPRLDSDVMESGANSGPLQV